MSSAPYGHACTSCVRAKCRCIPRASSPSCQRCHRLNKDCRPAPRRRHPKPLSKAAQLQQKMDGLMSLLNTGPVQGSGSMLGRSSTQGQGNGPIQESTSPEAGRASAVLEAGLALSPEPSAAGIDPAQPGIPPSLEEEASLQSFRRDKLPCFPFIHIPDTTSAQALQQESPVLWRCIAVAECRDAARQAALCVEIRETFAAAVLVDCQRSLDLLQGLLVYLAWITYQSQPMKSSLCMYCQLAAGLIFELGLHRCPPADARPVTSDHIAVGQLQHLRPPVSAVRSMNQRRAVLAFYVLSSVIAEFLGRMDPLRWTPHLTECLDVLAQSPESPHDAVLVQLVRIRTLAERVAEGPWNNVSSATPRAPSSFYQAALQSQFDQLKNQTPTGLATNTPTLLHLLHTEVTLHEPALTLPKSDPSTHAAINANLTRLDPLYACLHAIKAFFDRLLSLPPAAFAAFPLTHIIQTAHCFVTLFRLSTLDFPGWDPASVRDIVDITIIADQVADRWSRVAASIGVRNGGEQGDAYGRLAAMLSRLKAGWVGRLGEAEHVDGVSGIDIPMGMGMGMGGGEWDWEGLMGKDEGWLLDAFVAGGFA
ncbi:hypothetical protein BO71DRAFT_426074 [Aspergillus ellipticus CBS 707.79]|uniref:Zn(2)-C6 fungal-type domain-containing protein n=1 Tax=Aspergillus ellipticus CBS 707.79 TaxID=1448320 RepID=A0A319ECD2_9EURO|nr:hypothetical protein BO71DRAFT_426074 [Aspergillus ellipticus CBS 707.79]